MNPSSYIPEDYPLAPKEPEVKEPTYAEAIAKMHQISTRMKKSRRKRNKYCLPR